MDPILDAGPSCTGQVERLMACGMMEAKKNEISCSFRVCSRNLGKDHDQTELLDDYSLTRASENDSKSWFIVFISLHLFILHRPSSSLARQFSPLV